MCVHNIYIHFFLSPCRKDLANKKAPQYGSDDERAYAKEKVPDRNEKDFFEDDIDDFHNNREKVRYLLTCS